MGFRVELTARAERDIDSALEALTRYSPQAAARWYAALVEKVATLEELPDRCALAAEAHDLQTPLRELLFGKRPHVYRVLFVIAGETVQVLHVRHAARDWVKPDAVD